MLLTLTTLTLALAPQDTDASARADSWPQLRGPGGLAVGTTEVDLAKLDLEKDRRWKTRVPSGSSSPCVVGGLVVVTGAKGSRVSVTALDASDGSVAWMRGFDGDAVGDFGHVDAQVAMPTVCSDGERFVAYFGNYGLVALDASGQLLWERRMKAELGPFGIGSSPIIAGGNVILQRDGLEEAAVLALDVASGDETYRIDRFGIRESHATPFLWRNSEREELVISSGNQVHSYDPTNGEPIWSLTGVTLFPCTTPTGDADRLYYAGWSSPNAAPQDLLASGFDASFEIEEKEFENLRLLFDRIDANGDEKLQLEEFPPGRARDAFHALDSNQNGVWEFDEFNFLGGGFELPGRNIALAVRAGGSGDITETHVEWEWRRGIPYVASPLVHRSRVWLVKAGGLVSTLDAETGKRYLDRERLPVGGEYYMSPVGVGDHVLVGAVTGELYVLAASDELSIANTLDFGDRLGATPALVGGRIFVRTDGAVHCY